MKCLRAILRLTNTNIRKSLNVSETIEGHYKNTTSLVRPCSKKPRYDQLQLQVGFLTSSIKEMGGWHQRKQWHSTSDLGKNGSCPRCLQKSSVRVCCKGTSSPTQLSQVKSSKSSYIILNNIFLNSIFFQYSSY